MAQLDALSRELMARGKLIEAGFILRILPLADAADPERAEALRNAFFAGAHHLFTCVVAVLDPSTPDPTPADLEKMDAILAELTEFIRDFAVRQLATVGSA